MEYRPSNARELVEIAGEINQTRRCATIHLPPGEMVLDDPIIFGGLTNRQILTGLKLVGAGVGVVNDNGRCFGGTVLRYEGSGEALQLLGVSNARLQDFGLYAPNGTAVAVKASIQGRAWSKQILFERLNVSGSHIGFDLVGVDGPEDYAGRGQRSEFGYGQVDGISIKGCIARSVDVALRQNAPNIVNTIWDEGEIKARLAGIVALEGTLQVYRVTFVDDPEDAAWAAIYAKNAEDIILHRNRFELNHAPAFVIDESFTSLGSQISTKDNFIVHGNYDTPGVRVARQNAEWTSDDFHGMRGTRSWRMEVAENIKHWEHRRPWNPQVELVRI